RCTASSGPCDAAGGRGWPRRTRRRASARRRSARPCSPSPCRGRARHSLLDLLALAPVEPPLTRDIGEQALELLAAAVQPGHHGTDRSAHDLGDLLVREALDV